MRHLTPRRVARDQGEEGKLRATRQDFGMHHKIIWGFEVEETDGVEDSIVSCGRGFTS